MMDGLIIIGYRKISKPFFTICLAMSYALVFLVVSVCQALDEDGCLTCHQYPGLVRHEQKDGFKVLHIDEEKFFTSPHGKFRCTKCHTTIEQVPHTGETGVDCSTNCHQGHKGRVLPQNYPLRGFHKKEQSYIVSLQDPSSCRVCHALYPHGENKVVRALLNMHTGFMLCEVCHINRGKFKNLSYEWHATENAEFSGQPFGTYYKPHSSQIHPSDHYISRISAYNFDKGQKRALMNTWDTAKANEFIKKEKDMNPYELKKALEYFHRDIEKKEISVACDECHSSHSILDFNKLGFDRKKTKNLIYLNIKGLVTKYKVFYFPHLFEQ